MTKNYSKPTSSKIIDRMKMNPLLFGLGVLFDCFMGGLAIFQEYFGSSPYCHYLMHPSTHHELLFLLLF